MNYFKNIEELIVENEARKKATALKDNSSTLLTYWNIGKLIVEAHGGEKRAKYGDNLINEWGKKLSEKYGKNYGKSNLNKMRKFYITFPIVDALRPQLTWTHYRLILPIKNENELNYYINLVILNNLYLIIYLLENYKKKSKINLLIDYLMLIKNILRLLVILIIQHYQLKIW